jgi:hypothetical protein
VVVHQKEDADDPNSDEDEQQQSPSDAAKE